MGAPDGQPQGVPPSADGKAVTIARSAFNDVLKAVAGILGTPKASGEASERLRQDPGDFTPEDAGTSLGASAFGLKMGKTPGVVSKPADIARTGFKEPPPPPAGFEPLPAQAPTQITVHPAAPEAVPPPPKGFEPVPAEAPRTLKPQDMPFEPELGPEGKPSSAGAAASGITADPIAAPKPPGVMDAVRNAGRVVEQIFSPETVNASAKQAVAAIREMGGRAARDTATTEHLLEPAWKKVSALPDADRLNFLDYVENRSGKYAGAVMKDAELQSLANTLRTEFAKRADRIENLPSREKASFIEDYFPHFWKDPKAAMDVARAHGGASKQGSGASLRKRTVPTIADGIAAGLEPVTTNPLDATLRYVQSMDRFIASTEVLDAAKANGTVKYVRPQSMGASGHPEGSMKIPEGYAPLKGRGATDGTGAQAYAPEGWARIYNNYIDRGIHDWGGAEWGKAYDTARQTTNAVTALELGLSGYHMATMWQEGIVNGFGNAVGHAVRGRPIKAAGELAKGFYRPIGMALKGKKVQNEYLSPGTHKEMSEITDLLSAAGGRAKGTQHAPDYEFSSAGSYITALKRGQLKMQALADLKDIKGAPVMGTAKVAARNIGRVLSTVAQPIFEKYIPLVKNGAFAENMATWLERNPTATAAERKVAAQQLWDSVDNRFGEMVADNVFWNKTLKQVAMLGLRSWSWTFGGVVREIGGGLRDFARAPGKAIRGPKSSAPMDQVWTPKMDYVVGLPLTYGALSVVYQYLKTGEPPKDMQDLLGPRTGGTDPATGQPERLLVPGYMKDVFGFYSHPMQEATNKMATAPRKVYELLDNRNWRGDPIRSPSSGEGLAEDVPRWLGEYFKYAAESFGPITMRDMMKGKKTGSNLSTPEKAIGVRNAPRYITDPEGYENMMKGIGRRNWQKKERFEQRQKSLYE